MKKLVSLVSSLLFLTIISAKAEMGIGISGAVHLIDGSGEETTRTSGEVNKGSHDETAEVPEIFIETFRPELIRDCEYWILMIQRRRLNFWCFLHSNKGNGK